MSARAFLALAALLVAAPAALAQEELRPGDRVRIRVPDAPWGGIEGSLVALDEDSLRLLPAGGPIQVVPRDAITALEVRRPGSRRKGAWRGAKWGFAIGATVGFVTCIGTPDQCREDPDAGRVKNAIGAGLFVGGGSALLGALTGALLPGSRWIRVSLEP